jgi:hypothetical protein
MLFSVRTGSTSLGLVELPSGLLVAGQLHPSPSYRSVENRVRNATDAFLHLGIYDAVAAMRPPLSAKRRAWRLHLQRAARLQLALVLPTGEFAPADFVNLLEAPADRGVVVLASFLSAPDWVAATLLPPIQHIAVDAPAV